MSQNPYNPQSPQNPQNPQNPDHPENTPGLEQTNTPHSEQGVTPGQEPLADGRADLPQHESNLPPAPAQPGAGEPAPKSKKGLMIGLLLVLGVVIAVASSFFLLSGPKTKTYEDLTQGMTEIGKEKGMEFCADYQDTVLNDAKPLDQVEDIPDDTQVFFCSSVDMTSLETLMSADMSQNPKMMVGLFSASEFTREDFGDLGELEDGQWSLADDHWGVFSNVDDAKELAQKTLGGNLVESKE
ncbi:hypothetical protein ACN082_06100 [Rothia sp. CCM 9417]|uniref:hypothetical protein n=1 Tax=Rothia sp. CCM 9417 TaxID=3402657 RepID=UPI003ADFB928